MNACRDQWLSTCQQLALTDVIRRRPIDTFACAAAVAERMKGSGGAAQPGMRPLIMVLRRLVTVARRPPSVSGSPSSCRRRELLVSSERALMRIEQRIACQHYTHANISHRLQQLSVNLVTSRSLY